jgi:hypothetical protein
MSNGHQEAKSTSTLMLNGHKEINLTSMNPDFIWISISQFGNHLDVEWM